MRILCHRTVMHVGSAASEPWYRRRSGRALRTQACAASDDDFIAGDSIAGAYIAGDQISGRDRRIFARAAACVAPCEAQQSLCEIVVRSHLRLAKLTRPDTAGLLSRERLFVLLDRSRNARFTWVSGSGGAGKTSLVTSWLDRRKHRGVWYRIDAADGDPASFFYYLGLAARPERAEQASLPHFTPEYLGGLRQFTRRYFREFFARVRTPFVLVFDNCHEAGSDTLLEDIIGWALEEAPRGVAVICVSRKDPGQRFSHWMAEGATHISGEHLRLDAAEACAIAESNGLDREAAAALVAQVDGWAAGFILGLRAWARKPALSSAASAQENIFDYFTSEFLAAADVRLQAFLLRTAVFPVILPSLAHRLTGFSDSAALLADLHRSHFFTERRSSVSDEAQYEYHSLFREFLISKSRQELGAAAFAENCSAAAALLEAAGREEAAVELRILGGNWPALVRPVCALAPVLMSQGRWRTLLGWIKTLPPALAESHPSLLYWRGTCVSLINPAGGRVDLEAAYRGFQSVGEAQGSLLACAGTLEAGYLELGDQAPAVFWTAELDRLLAAVPVMPLEVEIAVIRALMGVLMAQPQHPLLARFAIRAAELLRTLPDLTGATELVAFASAYHLWTGDLDKAEAVLDFLQLDRQVMEGAPLSALIVCIMKSGVAWQRADHEESYAMVAAAQEIADDFGVHVLDAFIAAQSVFTALSALDLERSREALEKMRGLLNPCRRLEAAQYGVFRSAVAVLAGRNDEALRLVEREVPVAEVLGARFVTTTFQIHLAQVRILNGGYESALEPLTKALAFAREMPSHILTFQALLTGAWAAFRRAESAKGLETLRAGLLLGRQYNYMNCHPLWIPEMMREIFLQALQADIETDYVRRFIRKRRLAPGSGHPVNWPWPVQIYTLGRFVVVRDASPLASPGKGKQRVLDLLKAIIARGPHGAPPELLAGILWPETEGDTARDDLRVALYRLRKLLGDEQAVLSADGRIRLNPEWCWVDAFALETALEKPCWQSAPDPELLQLYEGNFLATDGDQPWLMAQRERLRSKFLRAIEAAGAERVAAGNLDGAIELYQRATEVDPLAETLYRRLMDCYVRQGRTAEAMNVYRRCRQMLSVVLGMKPGPETEALHDALASERPGPTH